jgi:hypothetical protein
VIKSDNIRLNKGGCRDGFPVPCSPKFDRYPDFPTTWIEPAFGWQFYNGGIDWAVPTGTPVKAAQKGKVTMTRSDATGYGTHVRIQHDKGYLTVYGHMSSFMVAEGDAVEAGQVIGLSDNTGNSTGPHLHFELRQNSVPIDPQPLLVTSLGGEPGEEPGEEPGGAGGAGTNRLSSVLPRARVTAVALNIRSGAGVQSPIIGLLQNGVTFDVLRLIKQGNDAWLQIGYNQFVALRFQGNVFAEWLA